jgi:acyl carrier protein
MTQDTLARLQPIFDELFGQESVNLTVDTLSDDIAGWDSAAHVSIIIAVEQEFGIMFDPDEIMDMENIGVMVNVIASKIDA